MSDSAMDSSLEVLESLPLPIVAVGPDFEILFANRRARRLGGASPRGGEARPGCRLFAGEECPTAEEACPVREAFRLGRPVRADCPSLRPGARAGFQGTAVPWAGSGDGRETVLLCLEKENDPAAARREREERAKLFALIKAAKKEWEAAVDCVDEMVVLVDEQGRVKRCNRGWVRFLGGKAFGEVLGRPWQPLLEQQLVKGAEQNDGAEMFHPSSGRTFLLASYPLAETAHGVRGTVFTLRDISDRKRMVARLAAKNQEIDQHRQALARALDQVTAMISQVAAEGSVDARLALPTRLDRCWQLLDCRREECPCHGGPPQRCWLAAGTCCDGGPQGEFVKKYDQCKQCQVYRQATADPISRISEEFNNMMHILRRKNQELEQAYAELKDSQSQLLQQEKMASIGQLAAGVAHEINNPVGFVTSNLSSLGKYLGRLTEFVDLQARMAESLPDSARKELSAARRRHKIDFILADIRDLISESLEGVERVRVIVQNLKSFSRVDQADYGSADLNQCLEDTLNIVWNELKYKAEVRKEYGELPRTWCYPQQLNQVFMNLLVNAAQALEEKGVITLRTWEADGDIHVAISDTGCGIAEENLGRLFEPFFTTKEVGKGTGLGLSIVYDIVTKQHNGGIEVSSRPGEGTTFTVRIPVVAGEGE